jgi:hypothetical protein
MLLFVCECQGGFVLCEADPGEVSTAARRFGARPDPIGVIQSTNLPPSISIELIDLVHRRHFAFLPHARACELALELILEDAYSGSVDLLTLPPSELVSKIRDASTRAHRALKT